MVTYVDRTLTCVDCGVEFIHSAADQEFYAEKGFASDPKRCASCRASRRAARDSGYDVRDIGGLQRGRDDLRRVARRPATPARDPPSPDLAGWQP
jgi:hypothetical protein